MRFSFNSFGLETYEVSFEIYVEDKLVQKQFNDAPKEMLMMSFIRAMEQIGRDKRPMKLVMSRPETIWDSFERKEKVVDNFVSFSNNAYIAWEEKNG